MYMCFYLKISNFNVPINYFYTEYKTDCVITKHIKAIQAFIERHEALSALFTIANFEAGVSFDIDVYELYNDDEFMEQWPNFKDELYENPTNTLNCIKLGIHQVLFLSLNMCIYIYTYIYRERERERDTLIF